LDLWACELQGEMLNRLESIPRGLLIIMPRIVRIDEGLELIMMGNWNEGESHCSLPIGGTKNSAQQQTLGDIRMTTWRSMCTEVKVKYWCQMPLVPVWREYGDMHIRVNLVVFILVQNFSPWVQ
jgi:hypothetical protein